MFVGKKSKPFIDHGLLLLINLGQILYKIGELNAETINYRLSPRLYLTLVYLTD
jgi:hypothetical protein